MLRTYHSSSVSKFIKSRVFNRINFTKSVDEVISLGDRLSENEFLMIRRLKSIALTDPDKELFCEYSAAEFFTEIRKFAGGLRKIGVERGDRVALMALPDEIELFISFFAIQAIGAVPVLINFLNPPDTIVEMFAESRAETLVVGKHHRLQLGALKLSLAGLLKNVISIGDVDYDGDPKPNWILRSIRNSLTKILFHRYEDLLGHPAEDLFLNPFEGEDAVFLFTSGTSAKPRMIRYTYGLIAKTSAAVTKRFSITSDDEWLLSVPFYHLAGLTIILGSLYYGSKISLTRIPRCSKPHSVEQAVKKIVEGEITILPGVPRTIEPVLEYALERGADLSNLRMVFSGASPMTSNLVSLVEKINENRDNPIEIVNFYASTECGPISSLEGVDKNSLDVLGKPFDGVEVNLTEEGELLVKSDYLAPGITLSNGFFPTGDQVNIVDGMLVYRDRLTDVLNINGEKISPLVIQREIEKVKGIKEAHVFGITKPNRKTDIVCVIIVPKKPSFKSSDLITSLEKRFPNYLKAFIPRYVFVEPDGIPDKMIGGTGKTPRRVFREAYESKVLL